MGRHVRAGADVGAIQRNRRVGHSRRAPDVYAINLEHPILERVRLEHRAHGGLVLNHDHVGIDHLVPTEFFVAKLKEALTARTDPDLVIIARTNARRAGGLEEAIRRGEAFAKAGADMVFCFTRNPEEVRMVGERVPPPLMTFAPVDGFATSKLARADFAKLGFRLAASSGTAFAAMYKAVKQSYECLAQDKPDPFLGPGGGDAMMKAAQATCGLDRLLEIERRTMKSG